MIEDAYGWIEGRALAWETARRGRLRAKATAMEGDGVETLDAIETRLGDARIVSFDIFDTLIHRRNAPAEGVHRKTAAFARAIAGPAAGQAIWAARKGLSLQMKAEMIADGSGDEPALDRVFEAALAAVGARAPSDTARALVAFETEAEARSVEPAPGAAALLTRIAASGRRLIAVSDMYLPGRSVEAIMDAAGVRAPFERVFVSADTGWTKKSGRMFAHVATALGADPAAFIHIGDRADSDAAQPRASGWRALHYVNRAEVAGAEAARIAETHRLSPALRRRNVEMRLTPDSADPTEAVIGPAAGLLALSALTRTRRIGARRLFHLTRDATLIGEIAEAARARRPYLAEPGLEIRELAVSRAKGALLQIRRAEDLAALAHLTPYLTGAPASAAACARAFGLQENAFGDAGGEGDAFISALLAAPAAALAAFDAARGRVEDYLRASGLLDPEPVVAVDIGYSGTFGVQLGALLEAERVPGRRIEFMFLATSRYIDGNLAKLHPQVRLHPGVALDHRARSDRRAGVNFAWAEPFFVDPERGALLGYEDGAPVFARPRFEDPLRSRHQVIRDRVKTAALDFIDRFHDAPGDLEEASALVRRRMARFAGRPTAAELRIVAALQHQSGQTEIDARSPVRRVRPLRFWRDAERLKQDDYWVQGSLRHSGLGFINRLLAPPPERDRRADPRGPWV